MITAATMSSRLGLSKKLVAQPDLRGKVPATNVICLATLLEFPGHLRQVSLKIRVLQCARFSLNQYQI